MKSLRLSYTVLYPHSDGVASPEESWRKLPEKAPAGVQGERGGDQCEVRGREGEGSRSMVFAGWDCSCCATLFYFGEYEMKNGENAMKKGECTFSSQFLGVSAKKQC